MAKGDESPNPKRRRAIVSSNKILSRASTVIEKKAAFKAKDTKTTKSTTDNHVTENGILSKDKKSISTAQLEELLKGYSTSKSSKQAKSSSSKSFAESPTTTLSVTNVVQHFMKLWKFRNNYRGEQIAKFERILERYGRVSELLEAGKNPTSLSVSPKRDHPDTNFERQLNELLVSYVIGLSKNTNPKPYSSKKQNGKPRALKTKFSRPPPSSILQPVFSTMPAMIQRGKVDHLDWFDRMGHHNVIVGSNRYMNKIGLKPLLQCYREAISVRKNRNITMQWIKMESKKSDEIEKTIYWSNDEIDAKISRICLMNLEGGEDKYYPEPKRYPKPLPSFYEGTPQGTTEGSSRNDRVTHNNRVITRRLVREEKKFRSRLSRLEKPTKDLSGYFWGFRSFTPREKVPIRRFQKRFIGDSRLLEVIAETRWFYFVGKNEFGLERAWDRLELQNLLRKNKNHVAHMSIVPQDPKLIIKKSQGLSISKALLHQNTIHVDYTTFMKQNPIAYDQYMREFELNSAKVPRWWFEGKFNWRRMLGHRVGYDSIDTNSYHRYSIIPRFLHPSTKFSFYGSEKYFFDPHSLSKDSLPALKILVDPISIFSINKPSSINKPHTTNNPINPFLPDTILPEESHDVRRLKDYSKWSYLEETHPTQNPESKFYWPTCRGPAVEDENIRAAATNQNIRATATIISSRAAPADGASQTSTSDAVVSQKKQSAIQRDPPQLQKFCYHLNKKTGGYIISQKIQKEGNSEEENSKKSKKKKNESKKKDESKSKKKKNTLEDPLPHLSTLLPAKVFENMYREGEQKYVGGGMHAVRQAEQSYKQWIKFEIALYIQSNPDVTQMDVVDYIEELCCNVWKGQEDRHTSTDFGYGHLAYIQHIYRRLVVREANAIKYPERYARVVKKSKRKMEDDIYRNIQDLETVITF